MPKYDFEGEGDALFWNDILFAGYPWRSDRASHKELADFLGVKVVSLQLIDARFYHLDTALTIVDSKTVALYPKAFTDESLAAVHAIVPVVIEANDEDALAYGLNAMSDGSDVVIPEGANHLIEEYRKRGKQVHSTPISEYQKSGGGVKCLTLALRR
jgi:N-dimethylarginine dimethylaminohydrolase